MAKTKSDQIIDILRVEGVNSQGYGQSPKLVMRDKRLDLEAKAIYCYIASFTGAGSTAFPSRDLMIDELNISKNRYYKYINQLKEADYIRVERKKSEKGVFEHNIYTLVALPNPVEKEEADVSPIEKPNQAADQGVKSAGGHKGVKRLSAKKKASVNELRERLEIENLKLNDNINAELIEDVFLAVEDINASEQITVSGNVKKRDAIEALISQLTSEHIRFVVNALSKNTKPYTNRKAYIQTCVMNSIFDVRNQNIEAQKATSEPNKILAAEFQKELEEKQRKEEIEEAYKVYPELKEIDNQLEEIMRKLPKALLQKDEITAKKIRNQIQQLNNERNSFKEINGLSATI